ncbi:MAG TPA: hypothetical protein VLJ76_00335 [Gaiellaceae bacterium]|nr:hypothetical protein [Gaiellaceae bacterium]
MSRFAVLVLVAAAVALIAVELGSGAIGFGGANLANPCTSKPHVSEGGIFGSVDAAVQRFGLSGLNGAACSLHTSREELVLSFAPGIKVKKVRWTKKTIEKALRGGLDKAAHDTAGGFFGDLLAGIFDHAIADPVAFFLGKFG